MNDKTTGNIQFRDEKRFGNGSIKGSYGYVRPDGSVSITHFMADPELGYLSETQNFEPGEEEKWADNWPTKKPNILMDKPPESVQPEVKYDDEEKLNLTSVLLPVEPIRTEHGIDLNPSKLEKGLVNPAVLEVINGETPLLGNDKKKAGAIGFATFNEFIPPDFPLQPFQLPQTSAEKIGENVESAKSSRSDDAEPQSKSANKYNKHKLNNSENVLNAPDLLPSPEEKYVKSKENNAEKSLPAETLRTTADHVPEDTEKISAKARSLSLENSDWYDRIISQTRREYLQSLE